MDGGTATLEVLRTLVPDRASPVPLHAQLAGHLAGAIDAGDLPPGTLLGNEVDLAEALGLSRPTVRSAIQSLVDQGVVVRRRGVGTRVVQPTLRRPLELSSLYDDLAAAGRRPTTRVLRLDREPADDDTAARLGVEPGAPVVRVERLRGAGRQPVARLGNVLPERFADLTRAELTGRGLYDCLRDRGVVLHSAVQTIGARTATADEAALLREPPGAALLTAERTTYDDHGRVVEIGAHLYAASRYRVEVNLLTR